MLLHKVDDCAFSEHLARAVKREAARLAALLLRECEVFVCPVVLHKRESREHPAHECLDQDDTAYLVVNVEDVLVAKHRLRGRHVYEPPHVLATKPNAVSAHTTLTKRDAGMRCAPMLARALKETDDAICVRPEDVWPARTSGEYTPEETAERLGRTRRVRAVELSYAGLPSRADDS